MTTIIAPLRHPLSAIALLAFILLPFGRIYELTTLAFSIFFLKTFFHNGLSNYKFSPQEKLFSILFFCIFIPTITASIYAIDIERSLKTTLGMLRHYFFGMGIILAVKVYSPNKALISKTICAVISFWVVDGFIQAGLGTDLLGQPSPLPNRVSGIFGEDAKLGYMLVPLIGLALSWTYDNQKWKNFFALSTLFAAGVLLSGDRGGWLGLFWLAVIGLIGIAYVYKKAVITISILAIPILASAVYLAVPETSTIKQRGSESLSSLASLLHYDSEKSLSASDKHRFQIFTGAYQIFKENPINGIGPRSFKTAYSDYLSKNQLSYNSANHAHQIILEVAASTGVIGLLALLIFFYILAREIIRSLQQRNMFTAGGLLGITAFLFPIGSHFSIYASSTAITIWSIIAISLAYHCSNPAEDQNP